MDENEKIALAEENIRRAIDDYSAHTYQDAVMNDVSTAFIERLARDNYYAKQELRELFRKSPVWDEELDALVINGTRTHDPDYNRIYSLARSILETPLYAGDGRYAQIVQAINFFTTPDPTDEEKARYIAAINELAPKAYAPAKKPSRIFKALCDALGVTDDTKGSNFQHLYAQFADELTTRKISFKLFVSINPAHFITMSNPKDDERGCTLTSCHSFNSTEYSYNNGCTGYARDHYTFIVFTVADPTDRETLNNRKTTRQIFAYKPGNGLLLQSRLYNTSGGTHGAQAESKVYRDLIQRELSALEEQPNLWRTFRYCGNTEVKLEEGAGFGGYTDWTYSDFDAKVSIRADMEDDYEEFEIGTRGICVNCAKETSDGVYCEHCGGGDMEECYWCEERYHENDLYEVRTSGGGYAQVCEDCRDEHYTRCEDCEDYWPNDEMTKTDNGDYVCPECLRDYVECDDCGEWIRRDDANGAVDSRGDPVSICDYCRDNHYVECGECGDYVHTDDVETAYEEDGDSFDICPRCRPNFCECDDCGRLHRNGVLVEGLCPECAAEVANNDEPENETDKEENIA